MEQILQQIEAYKSEMAAFEATTPDLVEAFRIKYLGTKGLVKSVLGEMKNVPPDQRKDFGQVLNEFKAFAEARYEVLQGAAAPVSAAANAGIDWSLPADPTEVGTRHPLSIVRGQMVSIFRRLGFAVAEGPEIEDDWHNFGAMNLPEDHPARDMQDTFYISQNPDWLLRTHTSSVQIREMAKKELSQFHKPMIHVVILIIVGISFRVCQNWRIARHDDFERMFSRIFGHRCV
jgi:phenylalanyl-tRNA synthetase alpha chain